VFEILVELRSPALFNWVVLVVEFINNVLFTANDELVGLFA